MSGKKVSYYGLVLLFNKITSNNKTAQLNEQQALQIFENINFYRLQTSPQGFFKKSIKK